jgi:DNA-binding transcriptional MerR regulator
MAAMQIDADKTFTLDELATAAGVNARTIRYYIQLELIDPPVGQTRAARYTWQHLRRLLEVKRLTEQGFSLERVREVLHAPAPPSHTAPSPRPGEVSVRSHIYLAPGLELVIEPGRAQLSSEQLRKVARDLVAAYARSLQAQAPSGHTPEGEGS